ncbi:MAG: aldose 1-epimerase family protein [Lachnospiraceae bacterium]
MRKSLENERLLIEVADRGSELVRIYDKKNKREVLWDGNPAVWPKHSPLLFPMVGQSYHNVYHYEGKEYEMPSHGFAWTSTFTFTKEEGELQAVLRDSEESLARYPFPFTLTVTHTLSGNRIRISWKVENTGDKTMLYNIGAHPAFVMQEGKKTSDMYLKFPGKESLHYFRIQADGSGCALPEEVMELPLSDGCVKITESFWDKGVYIFEHEGIEELSLLHEDKTPYVNVYCKGFPHVGVWTKPGAPFVCLEPWYGRCDNHGYEGELENKTGILTLEAGKAAEYSYEIEIA